MALTRVCNARKMLPAVITTNCLRSARRAVVVHRRGVGSLPCAVLPHPYRLMHANNKRLDGYISYNCKLEDELAILDRIESYKKYIATNYCNFIIWL